MGDSICIFQRLQGETFLISDGRTWLAVIALGMFCQALGWVMISKGLPKVAASRAGIFLLLQPTGAFFWDVLLLNRPTDGATFFGAALALAAIYFGARQ